MSDDDLHVEVLTEARFPDVPKINNAFMGGTGKRLCLICSYSWCLASVEEYRKPYADNPEAMQLSAIVVMGSDKRAVGCVKMSALLPDGKEIRASDDMERSMHELKRGEFYVEWLAVTEDCRGRGAGTMLLEWCEKTARDMGGTRLTIGVVNGNPAKRLYERFGFVTRKEGVLDFLCGGLVICCILGSPHCGWGGVTMDKIF